MADSSSDLPAVPPRTKAGEILDKSTKLGKFFASLTPVQFQAFALLWMTLFVSALAGFIVYKWQSGQLENQSMFLRSAETDKELLRVHCANEAKEARSAFAAITKDSNTMFAAIIKEVQINASNERKDRAKLEMDRDEARRKFEADERAKDRAVLTALTAEVQKMSKKPSDEVSCGLGTVLAPMPKVKVVTP